MSNSTKTKTTQKPPSASTKSATVKNVSRTGEMLPSARLEEVAKKQHTLNDVIRRAKEAESAYLDTIKQEQQNIIDQIEAFRGIISEQSVSFQSDDVREIVVFDDSLMPVESEEAITVLEDTTSEKAPDSVELSSIEQPPVESPFVESPSVETVETVQPCDCLPCACQQNSLHVGRFYAFCKRLFWIAFVLLVVYWGYWTVVDFGWIRPLPTPIVRPIIDEETAQLKIVRSVMEDTTLTASEQYVEASMRLYQEYYAIHGTGTDEEKRGAAREFAKKHVFPNTIDDSEKHVESDGGFDSEESVEDGDSLWQRIDEIHRMLREQLPESRLEQNAENQSNEAEDGDTGSDDIPVSPNSNTGHSNTVSTNANIVTPPRRWIRMR